MWDVFSHTTDPGSIPWVRGSQFDFSLFSHSALAAGSGRAAALGCAQGLEWFGEAQLYLGRTSLPCFPPWKGGVCSHPDLAYFSADKELRGQTQHLGPEAMSACCDTQWGTVCYHLWPFHYHSECSHLMWVVSKIKTTAGSFSCQDFEWKMVMSEKSKGDGTSSNIFHS